MTRRSEPRFDDGETVRSDFRDRARSPRDGRKTLQLCAQVRRALELAFLGECADPSLQDLTVLAVHPAPDASRLRVRILVGDDVDIAALHRRLENARPLLVDEVARATSRRKVPELVFQPGTAGDHDPALTGG